MPQNVTTFQSALSGISRWSWAAWPIPCALILSGMIFKDWDSFLTIAMTLGFFGSIKVVIFSQRLGILLDERFDTNKCSNYISIAAGANCIMCLLFMIESGLFINTYGTVATFFTVVSFGYLAAAGFTGRRWFPHMLGFAIWSLITLSVALTIWFALIDNGSLLPAFYLFLTSTTFGAAYALSRCVNDAEVIDNSFPSEAIFDASLPEDKEDETLAESTAPAIDYLSLRARLLSLDNPELQTLIADTEADERTRSMAHTVLCKRVAWESINTLPDWQLMTLVHNEATDNYTRDAASLELYNRNSQDLFNELRSMSAEQLLEIRDNPETNFDGYYEGAGFVLKEMGYRTEGLDSTSLYSC